MNHLRTVIRRSSAFLGFPDRYLLARSLFVFVFSLFAAAANAQNSPEVAWGIQWLTGQVQTDGSLSNESSSIATGFQSRSETAQTLKLMAAVPTGLVNAIAADVDGNTEYVAKKIVTLAAAGQLTSIPQQSRHRASCAYSALQPSLVSA